LWAFFYTSLSLEVLCGHFYDNTFTAAGWTHIILTPYFALVCSAFVGYMFSWIKGGGMESDFSYFLMLALLLIPYTMTAKT
jgi:hypothetical protein